MERKHFLSKSIFYIFLALCFFGTGLFAISHTTKSDFAYATTIPEDDVGTRNNLTDYFKIEDLTCTTPGVHSDSDVETADNLMDHNTFLSFRTTNSNYLKLSFAVGYPGPAQGNLYDYCYYPDKTDTTHFNFFKINTINFYINGKEQTQLDEDNFDTDYNFVTGGTEEFQNYQAAPEGFEMYFDRNEQTELLPDGKKNTIKITDKNNNVIEGVYTVEISLIRYTCTGGRNDRNEDTDSFKVVPEVSETITYNFYVLDQDKYLHDNQPILTSKNFDSTVSFTGANSENAFYLYSNYSSKSGNVERTNSLPFIEYDYTRYQANIVKTLADVESSVTFEYDKDAKTEVSSTQDVVKYKIDDETKTAKVYFTDVGNYCVSLQAIYVNETDGQKYVLEGFTDPAHRKSKDVLVYVYGYQANYTDFDSDRVDGKYPLKELKSFDMTDDTFYNSADITSAFLSSADDNRQDNEQTFTPTKIINFVNSIPGGPVKTDNTPITFTQNATLNGINNGGQASSVIYSTKKVSSAYVEDPIQKLNGKTLYRANFTGLTDIASEAGTYIYVLAYSFQDFWASTADRHPEQMFYQVFYFEIVAEQAKITVTAYDPDTKEYKNSIGSGLYYNQDIKIIDDTKSENYAYRRDVMIRIYAQEFGSNNYLSKFNGENGIDFADYCRTYGSEGQNSALLTDNAHYTIRLFYKSDVNGRTNFPINLAGAFDEYYFTIDKEKIEEHEPITARNVVALPGGSEYQIGDPLKSFSTNQSIILSWENKRSGAATYAYTRYFPLINEQFYGETNLSATIQEFLITSSANCLPINRMVDLSTNKNTWAEYEGNTYAYGIGSNVSGKYVLSSNGLYLVEVYDEAGNKAIKLYFIDNTSPMFALENSRGKFELVEESKFLQEESTLHWGKNKAIMLANLGCNFNEQPDNVSTENLTSLLFKDCDGRTLVDIYKAFYDLQTLPKKNLISISTGVVPGTDDNVSTYVKDGYSGWYLTIPINEINWYLNTDTGSQWASTTSGQDSYKINIEKEANITVLIRDQSNTRFVTAATDETDVVHYQNYYSARQEIVISYDTSEFGISFPNYSSILNSESTYETGQKESNGAFYNYKTSYLTPVDIQEEFYVKIKPTVEKSGTITQVEQVVMDFYPYVADKEKATTFDKYDETGAFVGKEVTYHFYKLSDNATLHETLYQYGRDEKVGNGEIITRVINSVNHITQPGKYVITRYYSTDNSFVYNKEKDFYERTLVLYVDPNPIVSDQTTVTDGSETHVEGLVGGEIFVGMYDNGRDANLVVTFPDSPNGNKEGQSLYDSTGSINNVLTTNKFPVKLHVPVSKYTKYAQIVSDTYGYGFNVEENKNMQNYNFTAAAQDQDPAKTSLLISEYALFVEVFNNSNMIQSSLVATSEMDEAKLFVRSTYQGRSYIVGINPNAVSNGFLKLYKPNSDDEVKELKDEGTYYIRISQGRFSTGTGETKYNKNGSLDITFAMTIDKTNPDFEARLDGSAVALKSDNVDSYIDGKPVSIQNYYTNQRIVDLVWARGNDYMAEIDIDEIVFETKAGTRTDTFYGGGVDSAGKQRKTPWVSPPEISNTSYIGQISLSDLGIYTNGGYVDVTMKYKNHSDEYYKVCKKRITVDLSAPHTNIDNLVNASIGSGYIRNFDESKLRTKQTADNDTARFDDETSYNISKKTGNFEYYSYTVSSSYLNTLLNTTESYQIYVRDFMNGNIDEKYNPNNEDIETTYSDFLNSKSKFKTINEISKFEQGRYYEIVETDRADNLTIYTIFVMNYSERAAEDENKLFSYTAPVKIGNQDEQNAEMAYTISDYNNAKANRMNHNIYSRPGFVLEDINFFGEAWTQIKVELRNSVGRIYSTAYYMTTPETTLNHTILKFDTNGEAQEVEISSLFSEISSISSMYKSILTIYNRQYALEGQREEAFYFNFQTTQLSYNWPTLDSQNSEFVGFTNPSDASLNSTEIATNFVTQINIYRDSKETGTPLLGQDGLTNKLGMSSIWVSANHSNDVSTFVDGSILRFVINPNFAADTRLIYEFTDNYGTQYSEVRLFKETIITSEVGSDNDLYAYYDSTLGRTYYVTSDGFKFTYNSQIYTPMIYNLTDCDGNSLAPGAEKASDYLMPINPTGSTAIKTITYSVDKEAVSNENPAPENTDKSVQYYITFEIELWDTTGIYRRSVYFILYNKLPRKNTANGSTLASGQFKMLDANGNNITEDVTNGLMENSILSQVRIIFSQPSAEENILVPVRYSISTDGIRYTELTTPTTSLQCPDDIEMQTYYLKVWYDESFLQNTYGNARYVFGNIPKDGSAIYRFNLTAQTTTYWVEMQTATGDTVIIQRNNSEYHTPAKPNVASRTYTNHYIVNMRYLPDQTAVRVRTNHENLISEPDIVDTFADSDTVTSVLYHITNKMDETGQTPPNIPAVDAYIVITFIPPTSKFVQEFYVADQTGALNTSKNLSTYTSENVIVNSDNPQTSEITLRWTRYNGISSNTNNIRILRDGIEFVPDITLVRESVYETEKVFSEITLKRSGRYTISFKDSAQNVQRFGTGNGQTDVFTLIFLKDVPFTLTYTDIETNRSVTTDPINKATYNGIVTLNIPSSTNNYYTESGPQITVERNGRPYAISQTNGSYIFSQSGTYRVKFSATSRLSNTPNVTLREEWYEFTILNEDQYRYSYIFNQYEKYYVERILKNDVDLTETFVQTLNLPKMNVNGKLYLSKLVLSYLDEKTGAGVYTITINSNDRYLSNASWTYKVTIQTGTAPIRISIGQGETTTSNITITYNVTNMWNAMGDCTVRVISYEGSSAGEIIYSHTITQANNTGEGSYVLDREGTFFVQVVTGENNDPLFSYKVTKKAPMNAATIIAIVLSAVALVVVIFLIIKLRKRISVK